MEQLVKIQLRVEMQKGAAKAYRRAVHEHEFPGYQDRALFLQGLVNRKRFLASVMPRRDAIRDAAHPVVQQRRINESRPYIQCFGELPGKPAKPPCFIGMNGTVKILVQ